MVRCVLHLAIVAVMVAPARAGVAVEASAPFTTSELVAALAVRGAPADDIAVRGVSPTAVEVRIAGSSQRIDLGGARGAAAARLVALQLVGVGDAALAISAPVAVAAPPELRWALGVAAGIGRGVAEIDFALTALRAEMTIGRGHWRWGASAGWLHGLERTPNPFDSVTAELGVLRAVVGFAGNGVEVTGGPELVVYSISAIAPGFTIGVGGGLRARLAGGAGWRVVLSADVEAFRHRVIVESLGVNIAATPRVAVFTALGLEVGGP